MILPVILYQLLIVLDAYTDRKGNVNHLRGAILYAIGSLIISLPFIHSQPWYHLAICAVLTRVAFFDPYLNWMRGKSFTYNGDPNNPDRSFIDKLEDATGLSIFWLRVIYIVIYATHLFIWAKQNL